MQHRTGEGCDYCAAVVDVCSRRHISCSIADHLCAKLVVDALEMARWQRNPAGTVVHLDRGPQSAHELAVRAASPLCGPTRIDGQSRLRLRQVAHGVVLRLNADRSPGPPNRDHPGRSCPRDLPMDRVLIQPPPTPFLSRLHQVRRLRESSRDRRFRGMITTQHLSEISGTGYLWLGPVRFWRVSTVVRRDRRP